VSVLRDRTPVADPDRSHPSRDLQDSDTGVGMPPHAVRIQQLAGATCARPTDARPASMCSAPSPCGQRLAGSGVSPEDGVVTTGAWEQAVLLMAREGGVATRERLLRLGVGDRMLRRRLAAGLLIRVNPRVVALPGISLDLRTRSIAAALACPDALLTGPSAAALLGPGPWQRIDLGTEPWLIGKGDRSMPARFVSHPGARAVSAGGIPVAHPADAVVDLLRFLPAKAALEAGQQALQRQAVTLDGLVAAHARLAHLRGAAQLGRTVRSLARGTHSEAERRLVELIEEAGITGWVANLPVRVGSRCYVLDIAFEQQRIEVAVDGRAFHTDAVAFQNDRTRQNDLIAAGWTILRFTWDDIVHRPEDVVRRIRAILAQRAA
jgi:very-short-patch-repair endonuclease